MPFSYAQYAGNGSTTTFSVPFPYLLKAHVKLYTGFNILSGAYTTLLVDGVDYTWSSTTQVQTTVAPANGVTLTVLRDTPDSSQLVPWQDGSNLVADDMNIADQQNLYVVQEQQDRNDAGITQSTTAIATANTAVATANAALAAATTYYLRDGSLPLTGHGNAGGYRWTNLGAPVAAADAASKGYVDSNVGSVSASATAAAASAAAAAASASGAGVSAGNASTSASNASTSAGNASTSATNAASSASASAASAATASAQASSAGASASNASTSAAAAANSATSAASSAASALAAFDQFDDRYLGAKTSDPSTDNDGDPLSAGLIYFNSVAGTMRVYTGAAWVTAYVPGVASGIAFTPYGSLAAGNVQNAIQELLDEQGLRAGVFYENAQTVTANYTISTNKNAMSVGPIAISSGVTVTIPATSTWAIL